MRPLALLVAATALVATAAVPASAGKHTRHVPILHCDVWVETQDAYVAWHRERGAHYDNWGQWDAGTDCPR